MGRPSKPVKTETPAEFSFEGLDRVLHEKARLGILTALLTHRDGIVFGELKNACSLTDGNLNRHLATLQEAQLVEIWKGHKGRRPQTLVRLTASGKKRFLEYLELLESIVSQALQQEAAAPVPPATHAEFIPLT